jgi:hypothetical protein
MKMLKFALITIVVLVITSIVAFYVNYYHYSWTSFINPFGCSCKEIRVKSVGIGIKNAVLAQQYDLVKLGNETKVNPNYGVYYDLRRFSATRNFGEVKYIIRIDYYPTSMGNFYEVYYSHDNTSEPKTTPSAYIRKNINQMIDEMPLNDEQKIELKSKVTVSCRQTLQLSW